MLKCLKANTTACFFQSWVWFLVCLNGFNIGMDWLHALMLRNGLIVFWLISHIFIEAIVLNVQCALDSTSFGYIHKPHCIIQPPPYSNQGKQVLNFGENKLWYCHFLKIIIKQYPCLRLSSQWHGEHKGTGACKLTLRDNCNNGNGERTC